MRALRNAAIIGLVIAALVAATYRIWYSEARVRRRVLAALSPFVAAPVRVGGASAGYFRGLAIDELVVGAHPRVRGESLAQLVGIRLERGGGLREGRGWVASIRRGEVTLERGADGRWNFEGAFARSLPLAAGGGVRKVRFLEPLDVRIEVQEPDGSTREESGRLAELKVSRYADGTLVLSSVPRHPYWKDASLRVEYEPRTARWRLEIQVDSLRASGDELARWLPAPLSELPWQGMVDARLELETAPDAPPDLRGEILHYDGRLALPEPLPAVEHLAARIRLDGEAASLARAHGSVAGADAGLEGELWRREGGAEVRLRFESLPLSMLRDWGPDPRLSAWLLRAAPAGSASGVLRVGDILGPAPAIAGSFAGTARSAIGIDALQGEVTVGEETTIRVRAGRILGVPFGAGEGRLVRREEGPALVLPRLSIPGGQVAVELRLEASASPPRIAGTVEGEGIALAELLAGLGVPARDAAGRVTIRARVLEIDGLRLDGEAEGASVAVGGLEAFQGIDPEIASALEGPRAARLAFALTPTGLRIRGFRLAGEGGLVLGTADIWREGGWGAAIARVEGVDPAGAPASPAELRRWVADRPLRALQGRIAGERVRWEPVSEEAFWAAFNAPP